MTRTSWIHRIKNFDRLKLAFDNLKEADKLSRAANSKRKREITSNLQTISRQKRTIESLRAVIAQLHAEISILSAEPERKNGCNKPRIDTDDAAKAIRERVANRLNRPMWYYHCRICPPSPLTHQRYYHLTSQERDDNCG
jgi:hypothetical protein